MIKVKNEEFYHIQKQTLIQTKKCFSQYIKWVREEIFEKIRISNHPELPSRQRCIWMCTISDLPYWLEEFRDAEIKIFQIKTNGIIHIADGNLITTDTFSLDTFKKNAVNYWEGTLNEKNRTEYLFEGELIILKECLYNEITKQSST